MAKTQSRDSIVIVGAGIIGLNNALALSKKGHGSSITVKAEYLPGDTSRSYTSPWAGCNFSAISGSDANALRWDKLGYAHLSQLADTCSEESFVRWTPSIEFWDEVVPRDKIKNMSEYLKDFKILPDSELPAGVKFGISCTTLTVNAPEHIKFLYKTLRETHNVHFERVKLPSIASAFTSPTTRVVLNCTGLGAATLSGVEDAKCYPTRGQVVLVKNPEVKTNTMRHGLDYETYIIPRPGSNGNVILGGYMQKGNGDFSTYASETESILKRARELSPEIGKGNLEVLAAFAGLRPSREGGARVEKTEMDVTGKKRVLVHNYGAGGTGFQAGWGMAVESVQLAEGVLGEGRDGIQARL